MKNVTTLAGISITLNFSNKLNDTPIKSVYTSSEPLVSIYKTQTEGAYTVNIIARVPLSVISLQNSCTPLSSGLFLNNEKTLFLNYNGVSNISTSVNKPNEILLCRTFSVVYDSETKVNEDYDLYHIQFNYSFLSKNFQSAEAIIVKLNNTDPETDRGTVTTVRSDEN
ncbi:hypothetical protein [Flavivirga jejuensis]|uniref:Uncharacterized protein n=1 Tax=Flavivirga jejuensis TaxID=870487 RepID=A0ABT8WQ59_9FLAO|nr:hypothetical protein [Flavivirga jejuensis]MDO5975276.1 hypothetical protein [Flavivirga jejuensis]